MITNREPDIMTKKESMKIVPPGKKKCIWMEAGVVAYKLCDNNYDCSTCAYDHAMDARAAKQKQAAITDPAAASTGKTDQTWVDMMMQLPASQRKCRYMLTEEIGRKLCPNAYECGTCSFDQMMQERIQAEPLPVPAPEKISEFELAEGFYYHDGHTWARPEYGGRIRVGIDDFARKLLGEKSRIEMPDVGCTVTQSCAGFTVKRNGQEVQVLSPVDGVVTHINKELPEHPELMTASPYDEGWLCTIEPTSLRKNLKSLYYGEDARNFIRQERDKLFAMANDAMHTSANGDISVEDIFKNLEGKAWIEFAKVFLKS